MKPLKLLSTLLQRFLHPFKLPDGLQLHRMHGGAASVKKTTVKAGRKKLQDRKNWDDPMEVQHRRDKISIASTANIYYKMQTLFKIWDSS